MENLENLKNELVAQINGASDIKMLEEARVAILGKKGRITEMMKGLGALSIEEKKEMGKGLNILKSEVENALENRKAELEAKELNAKLAQEKVDVTLPCRPENQGRIHPVSKIYEEVVAISGRWDLRLPKGRTLKTSFITLMR